MDGATWVVYYAANYDRYAVKPLTTANSLTASPALRAGTGSLNRSRCPSMSRAERSVIGVLPFSHWYWRLYDTGFAFHVLGGCFRVLEEGGGKATCTSLQSVCCG